MSVLSLSKLRLLWEGTKHNLFRTICAEWCSVSTCWLIMKFGSKLAEQFQFLASQKSQYSTFEVSYMNPLPIEALRY